MENSLKSTVREFSHTEISALNRARLDWHGYTDIHSINILEKNSNES